MKQHPIDWKRRETRDFEEILLRWVAGVVFASSIFYRVNIAQSFTPSLE